MSASSIPLNASRTFQTTSSDLQFANVKCSALFDHSKHSRAFVTEQTRNGLCVLAYELPDEGPEPWTHSSL